MHWDRNIGISAQINCLICLQKRNSISVSAPFVAVSFIQTASMSLQPTNSLNQGDNGTYFPNHVLNQLLNQSRNQLGGMSTNGGANYVSGNHTGPNNNLLAAAVQQQLMASLVSSNFQLLQPQAGQRLANGCPNPSGLNTMPLSGREAKDSQRPQSARVQEGSVGSTRKVATTQIPCQARGMSTDHNSLVSSFSVHVCESSFPHNYHHHLTFLVFDLSE